MLQLATYPFLFLRSARAARVMAAAPGYLAEHPGRYQLPLRLEMDELWRDSRVLSTFGFRASVIDNEVHVSPGLSDGIGRGILTERDLLEEDATVFQYRAEISARGSGRSYRNWLRERPRYSRLFSFLATHVGDDAALRLLPILVRIAYRTTRPLEGFFSSFATVLHFELAEHWDDEQELEDILERARRGAVDHLGDDDLTIQKPELEDPAGWIDDEVFTALVERYQQLPIAPLARINLLGTDKQREHAREALRMPWQFFNRYTGAIDDRLGDYFPPAMTIALDDPGFPRGSTLLWISPLLRESEFPVDGRTYSDWLNVFLKGRILSRALQSGSTGPNEQCPHVTCGYHSSGLCRGWMTVPKAAADCEFPEFLARITNHRLSADGRVLEPITTIHQED